MDKVFFTIDSAGDLPDGFLDRYTDIEIIPLHILLGSDCFEDGVNVNSQDVINYCNDYKTLPTTAAVTGVEYSERFKRITDNGYSVVHISLSSKISSSCQNALIASREFKDVFVVDSLLLSSSMSLLLLKAIKLREEGKDASSIAAELEAMKDKVITTFIIDKLDYLHKGGRCSAVAAFGANALGLKPCIEMNNGTLSVKKKYRGKLLRCQEEYISELIKDYGSKIDSGAVIFAYTPGLSPEDEEYLKKEIKKKHKFKEIFTSHPGCTITSHCGPNTLAMFFMIE